MKTLLSQKPSQFKYPLRAKVRAPLYVNGKEKLEGTIMEGVYGGGPVFYEIATNSNGKRDCRFAAREEDVELIEKRTA